MQFASAEAYKDSHNDALGMKGFYTVTVDSMLSFMDGASTSEDQSLKGRLDDMATKAKEAMKVAVAGRVMESGTQ